MIIRYNYNHITLTRVLDKFAKLLSKDVSCVFSVLPSVQIKTSAAFGRIFLIFHVGKKSEGKAIPLQAWTGPDVSRRLRLPDFKTIII
jgi:hypothetical protein